MLKEERHNYILSMVNTYHKVLSSELSKELKVSEDTIRRDLKELADTGEIKKVHGGAMINSTNPFRYKDREVYALDLKIKLARKAINLVQDGMVIIMDGGTTNLELARIIPKDTKVTVFTNSFPIAVLLSNHPSVNVMFLGGKVHKDAQITIGYDILDTLKKVRADMFFLGTRGIDVDAGVTEIDWEEAQLKRAAIESSNRVVTLCISEKVNTVQTYQVARMEEVNLMVTELDPNEHIFQPYHKLGLEII